MNGTETLSEKRGDFDLGGYEVIQTQFFVSASIISVTFSFNKLRFTSACIRRFDGIENVELLVHPERRLLAVRPCPSGNKNAMRWARLQNDAVNVRAISGSAFLKTLYELFGWDISRKYRLRGAVLGNGGEPYALYDAKKPEVYFSRCDIRLPWSASGFGTDYYSYRNSRLCCGGSLYGIFAEYDTESGLQPTKPEKISENVRCLIESMRIDEGDYEDKAGTLY